MDSAFSVLLALLIFTTVPAWTCLFNRCCQCGSMTPRDPYILLHSELVLNCTINASSQHDSSSLYFLLKPKNVSIPESRIPDRYITIVNNRTISLRKTMASLREAGTYYCNIKDVEGSMSIVDRQVVELEYPLRNVTNFHCEIYDWDVNKSCTWDLGPYVNPNNINVTLYGHNGRPHVCPNMANQLRCVWEQSEDNIIINSGGAWGYMVRIINMKLNKTILTRHMISDITTIVRPAPVRYLHVHNTTDKGCVNVTWEYNRPNREQAVEVKYYKYRTESVIKKAMILKNSIVNTTICNLTAYSEYMFEVRVKPQNYQQDITGYWSKPTKHLYKTTGDIPGAAPVLTLGSYLGNHELCVKDMDIRTVILYWKSITNMESNGNDTYYEVHYRQIGDSRTEKKDVKQSIMRADLNLKCRKSYHIKVFASNEYGLSSIFGSIVVPPNGTVEVPDNILVEADNRIVNVSWDYNPHKNVSFTVYWCSKRGLRKEVSWEVAGFEKRSLVFNASDFEEIHDLKFGVSADSLTDNISSGFEWITCVYRSNEAPAAPRKVSILSNKDGFVINWIPPTCDELTSKPVRYQLSWCRAEEKSDYCEGEVKTRYIQAHDSVDYVYSLSEKDVEMSEWYGIVIRSISSNGKKSAPTDMFYGRPVRSYMIAEEIVGVVVASVIGLLFFAAGVMFIIKHCYHAVKSAVKLDPIHLPTVQTTNTSGSAVMSVYKENYAETEAPEPIGIPQPTSPLVRQNGIQFQYSMDSGRGSLPVEDFLDHDIKHPPLPKSAAQDGSRVQNPPPFIQPRPESCLQAEAEDNCLKTSSLAGSLEWGSSPVNYRAICQAMESDSSSDETSSVASEVQEEEIKSYVKAATHSSLDNMAALPDYINDCVKSGRPGGEKHVKCCSTAKTLLTHPSINVTNHNHCVSQGTTEETASNKNSKLLFKSSSIHSDPIYDRGDFASSDMAKLPALEVCNILISVESCSLEKRLSADEVDNASMDSGDSLNSQTSLHTDSGSVSASSGNIMASSDYLPIDSVQCGSSCFSIYDSASSAYVS